MAEKFIVEKESKQVQVHLPDGKVVTGPRGAEVRDFLNPVQKDFDAPIVGAVINHRLKELTYPIKAESDVTPITMGTPDGMRIYRRSLTMLTEVAFTKLFPDSVMTIDHSVSSGGYFCQVKGNELKVPEDLTRLKEKMLELVDQDIQITKKETPLPEVIEKFKQQKDVEKIRLLKHRRKDYLVMYSIGDHSDYHQGYMVPSTGYLKWFDIEPIDGGFTLRFPRRHDPTDILPLGKYPKLLSTFREYGDWLGKLGIDSVGALNDATADGRIREVILVAEALHEQRISEIAAQIAAKKDIQIVMIAGPSSSGKTSTARRISIQLLARGIQPFALEVDNYFVNRDQTPLDENGELDFEHVDALDKKRLSSDLEKLIEGEAVQLPKYDFKVGRSGEGDVVKLNKGQIIIAEGIHGLNPKLIEGIPADKIYRIYISDLTQLNLDRHNRVSTTDTRLLRRIVRDARTRGYTCQETIQRWESVRRGEKRYIFPYQENADLMFNSALVYELAALKSLAEPLLRQVPFGSNEHIEVKRLLALLDWFLPLDTELIPDNSLLREFIGGSILKGFKIWQRK
jgi:uridine kinase